MRIPEGTTHFRITKNWPNDNYSFYIIREQKHHQWLGGKHGGWSPELPYIPQFGEVLPISKLKEQSA